MGFLSSCEKQAEEILSDASITKSETENQNASPIFEGVNVEAIKSSSNARQEEKRFLSFNTVADFEKIMASLSSENLEEWEKHFGFESARKTKDEETLSKEGIEDDVLAAVLSPENIIQIGKWAFRIDIRNERVAVVEADSKENVMRLFDINVKTPINKDFMWFSTNDEVINLLQEGVEGTYEDKVEGIFCSDRHAKRKKDLDYHYYWSGSRRLKSKAVYQKAGVYFSLLMKTEVHTYQLGIWQDVNLFMESELESIYSYSYKKRCGDAHLGVDDNTYYYSAKRVLDHRVHSGTRALKYYNATAKFYVRYPSATGGYDYSDAPTVSISDN